VIRLQRRSGTFLPTFEQHQLLRAALLRDAAQVREAFVTWKSRVDIDAIDSGSMRLLPLLYRNLTRIGIDDPLLPRLKGVYRQVWFRNQLILEHGARSLRAFECAGISAVVLKGAALAGTVYEEPALRPMEDFDVLVSRDQFKAAVRVLLESGWSFHPPLADPEPHFVFQHAVGFRREGGGELDLHWSATGLPFDRPPQPLTPAEQLLQVCAHATLLNPDIPPIRWAADAYFLLARGDFPWGTLIDLARERGWSLTMHRALEYLRDGLHVPVPPDVLPRLARQKRFGEHVALAIRNGRGRMAYVQFVVEWTQHGLAGKRGVFLLPRFLRSYCRVESNLALARLVTARLVKAERRR
jgi:hypothetical protein